jgi:hypothetical protein
MASFNPDELVEGMPFRCTKCNSLVQFDGEKIILGQEPTPTSAAARPVSGATSRQEARVSRQSSTGSAVVHYLFGSIFGLGLVLVVLFFFLPVIDQASVGRQRERVDSGQRRQDRLDGRNRTEFAPDKESDDERKKRETERETRAKTRDKERKEWEKTREKYEEELDESISNLRGWNHLYSWGQLIGFLLLAVGSVGFLCCGPGIAQRVVGSIVITAEVLLFFGDYFVRMTRILP